MELHNLVEKVSKKFFITERDIRRILSALMTSDDIWEVIDLADVPVMALCEVWKALEEKGLVEVSDKRVSLTAKGLELARSYKISPIRSFTCKLCEGRGITLAGLEKVEKRFKEIAKNRPEAIQDYDQGYILEDVTLLRVALMWQKGDLQGRELLVLGDDDLVSIAAGLTGVAARVTVLDIDDRLLEFIQDVSEQEKLGIEVIKHDLRYPLPENLQRAFDTFITDPTESLRGLKAFLGRSLSALKGPGSAGYFGLTRREASLQKWQAIQRFLLERGAVITDILDDFNAYVNWPYIETMCSWEFLPVKTIPKRVWYRSAQYRLELLGEPGPDTEIYSGDIFFDEETATA
ncbi:MAG: putative methyltransferase [Chloroflexi bacterium]|nr:MAG: putative methyltransferase [Chloroflexota bacterium]HDN79572.1 putative methyltransferase [Chloroflexota bacterium]